MDNEDTSENELDNEEINTMDSDNECGPNKTLPMSKSSSPNIKSTPESPTTKDASLVSEEHTVVTAGLDNGLPAGEETEVVVECCAPYDGHTWINIGDERQGMAPDAVQYARALRPPYHLLSFLRMKGHSTKGISCTDKNTLVFVVLEGEISVILQHHTVQC